MIVPTCAENGVDVSTWGVEASIPVRHLQWSQADNERGEDARSGDHRAPSTADDKPTKKGLPSTADVALAVIALDALRCFSCFALRGWRLTAAVAATRSLVTQTLGMDDELPPKFSDLLGQLVYLAGRTDNLLGALTPSTDKLPEGNRGLSGTALMKALRPLSTPGSILEAYPDTYAFRSQLVHGSMNFSGNVPRFGTSPRRGRATLL